MSLIQTFKNFSGVQKLRLILWIRGFGLLSAIGMGCIRLLYCFTNLFERPPFCHSLNPITITEKVNLIVGHTSFLYVILNALHWIYLWKAIRLNSICHWRCYLVTRVLLDIWGTSMWIILSSTESNDEQIGVKFYLHLLVTPTTIIILGIFEILVVRHCYKKLDAPIILELRKYCRRPSTVPTQTKKHQDYDYDNIVVSQENTKEKSKELKEDLTCETCDLKKGDFSCLPLDEKLFISSLYLTIEKSKFLGRGQFGMVFQGILRAKDVTNENKKNVAVKMINDTNELACLGTIFNEIKVLAHAEEHPNVVQFYGVSSDASNPKFLYLILELCELGSLLSYLQKNSYGFDNWMEGPKPNNGNQTYVTHICDVIRTPDLIRFCHQIATGMAYLASKKIVHGDLAARNVLITEKRVAKITDFGISRKLYNYELYIRENNGLALPWKWMSIESLEDFKFSEKSDVWSFGVLLWEIFTLGGFPYEGITWTLDFFKQLRSGMRLQKPLFCPYDIYKMMTSCWEPETDNRPSFANLASFFQDQTMKTRKDFQVQHLESQEYINAALINKEIMMC